MEKKKYHKKTCLELWRWWFDGESSCRRVVTLAVGDGWNIRAGAAEFYQLTLR